MAEKDRLAELVVDLCSEIDRLRNQLPPTKQSELWTVEDLCSKRSQYYNHRPDHGDLTVFMHSLNYACMKTVLIDDINRKIVVRPVDKAGRR
jgi:hypothetical protein